jgi:signal transduction histidine kinase
MQGITKILDTSDFPPRWSCGDWTSLHGWTHVAADLATFGAYFAIPVVIVFYVRRRTDVQFPTLFWLFAGFILSCGTVHLVEATIFWQPWYRLSALVKVITAVLSWGTVFALIHLLPQALRLPGLAAVNAELEQENASRRRAEVELRRRNVDLDRFAYVASHDLKAPLRAISMLARWAEEDAEGTMPEKSEEHLRMLRQRVDRLEKLLDDLLAYSRVGRTGGEPEEIDVAALVRGVAEIVGVEGFELVVARDLPALRAPRAPVEQVFLNLIANAIKHHDRPTGRIAVGGRRFPDGVEYWVEDDGPGIPPEFRERVFEMFQTLRPRDEVEGSGMGLALIRKILEAQEGEIHVEDARGERGSRFVFTWPERAHAEADASV